MYKMEDELYCDILDLFSNKKYKEVIKYSKKYLELVADNKHTIDVKNLKARAFRNLGIFDEALIELEDLFKNSYNKHTNLSLFYLYVYMNKYEKALNLIPYLYQDQLIKGHSILITELYLKKALGIPIKFKKGSRSDYVKEQILNYDEQKFEEHINVHIVNENNESDDTHSKYKENINLKYLIECVKEGLKTSKKANVEDIFEIHYFYIPNIGVYKNETCNYLKVLIVPNTLDIITMYPDRNIEYEYNMLKCDYDKLYKKENQKILSRIDKFNKKYNLK